MIAVRARTAGGRRRAAVQRPDRPGARVFRADGSGRARGSPAGRGACGCGYAVPGWAARCRRSASKSPACWTVTSGARPGWRASLARRLGVSRPRRGGAAGGAWRPAVAAHRAPAAVAAPQPEVGVPRVLGVDDFALRRGQVTRRWIDAQTGSGSTSWPGVRPTYSRRGCVTIPASRSCAGTGPAPFGEAVRGRCPARSRPGTLAAVAGLAEAILKEVAAHARLLGGRGPPRNEGRQAQTTAGGGGRSTTWWSGSRAPGMLPAAGPVAEHDQALRPRRRPERMVRAPGTRPRCGSLP